MLRIHLQYKAKEDIKNIWKYSYEEWGIEQADKYLNELTDKLKLLSDNPQLGVSCDYIRIAYRQYQVNKHIIFYIVGKDRIQIIRVLHEKMDFKRQMN